MKGSFLAEKGEYMEFFNSAVSTLQTLVVALGAALCVWGGINLLEGYGQDNPGAKSQGVKHVIPNYVESKSRNKNKICCVYRIQEPRYSL